MTLSDYQKLAKKQQSAQPPSTSGNSGVDKYVTDKTPESVAKAAGRAANGVGNTGAGSFGDYQSYIRQNGGYVPEGLPTVQTGIIQGTGKGKNDKAAAEAAAMNKQGWDNVQGLSGMSTQEVMDYYMGNGQRDYDKDMALAGAYLTDQYNQDKKNKNSDYSRDVAQRKEDFLKDPNNLYALAMEEGQKNNWGDAEYAEFFDIMDKLQEPDYLGNVWDYQSGFGNYRQRQEDDHMWKLFGGEGVSPNAINEKARDIADGFGKVDDLNTVYQDIENWAKETGATEENVRTLLNFVDQGLADKGYNYKFSDSYSNRPQPEVDQKTAMQSDLTNWTTQKGEADAVVRDMQIDVVKKLLDSGKYSSDGLSLDENFDITKAKDPKLRAAFNTEIAELELNDQDYQDALGVQEEANKNVDTLTHDIEYYDTTQEYEKALDKIDEEVSNAQTTAGDLGALEAGGNSATYQRIVNDYMSYLEENDPEALAQFTNGLSRNEFTGDYEVPVDQLERDKGFMQWYHNQENPVWQQYNTAPTSNAGTRGTEPVERGIYTNVSPYIDGAKYDWNASHSADDAARQLGIPTHGQEFMKFKYAYIMNGGKIPEEYLQRTVR